jgi:hypothetical protein
VRPRHETGGNLDEEHPMTQYLLSVVQPDDGPEPAPDELEKIMRDVDAVNEEMQSAGARVFAGGLHPASTATVVKVKESGEVLMTDGPFAEGKEHIGGFWIIEAADLDAALEWARKGSKACTLPIEVRPFQDDPTA